MIACFLTMSCASTPLSINAWTRAAHTCSFDKHPLQNYTYQATFSPMSTLGEYKNTVRKSRKIYSPSVTGNSLNRKKHAKWTGAWLIPSSSQQEFCSEASLLWCLESFFRSWLHGYMLSRTWWSIHNLWSIHSQVYTGEISSLTDCPQLKLLLSSFMSAVSLLEDGLLPHLSKASRIEWVTCCTSKDRIWTWKGQAKLNKMTKYHNLRLKTKQSQYQKLSKNMSVYILT